jgi:O-antigen/teichoic acid export membrane protein
MTLAQLVDFVTTALCGSLVIHAASQPEHGSKMARAVLLRAFVLAVIASLVLTIVVPPALRLLNPQYGEMNSLGVIGLLTLATVIRVFYSVWAELQKSRRKMRAPLLVNLVSAIVLFALMPGLASIYGALGGAIAVVAFRVVNVSGAGISILISGLRGRSLRIPGSSRKGSSASAQTPVGGSTLKDPT